MLLTMQQAYKDEFFPMPNPERMDKVEDSMENLEEVVRERNRAYHNLEVGTDGERDNYQRVDFSGRLVPYKPLQHAIPRYMNKMFNNKIKLRYHTNFGPDVVQFLRRLEEKKYNSEKHEVNVQLRDAARIVRRFPDVDMDALQEKFPEIDPNKLKRWKKCRQNEFSEID